MNNAIENLVLYLGFWIFLEVVQNFLGFYRIPQWLYEKSTAFEIDCKFVEITRISMNFSLKIRIVFSVLVKRPIKFEDILTFLTTRTSNDIEFNKNLQVGGGMTVALESYDVWIRQEWNLFLFLQTF